MCTLQTFTRDSGAKLATRTLREVGTFHGRPIGGHLQKALTDAKKGSPFYRTPTQPHYGFSGFAEKPPRSEAVYFTLRDGVYDMRPTGLKGLYFCPFLDFPSVD